MIDFHTHILPGLDDGAKTLDESIQLLKMEEEQGVDTIVLTPHYYHEREDLKFKNKEFRYAFIWERRSVLPAGWPVKKLLIYVLHLKG